MKLEEAKKEIKNIQTMMSIWGRESINEKKFIALQTAQHAIELQMKSPAIDEGKLEEIIGEALGVRSFTPARWITNVLVKTQKQWLKKGGNNA